MLSWTLALCHSRKSLCLESQNVSNGVMQSRNISLAGVGFNETDVVDAAVIDRRRSVAGFIKARTDYTEAIDPNSPHILPQDLRTVWGEDRGNISAGDSIFNALDRTRNRGRHDPSITLSDTGIGGYEVSDRLEEEMITPHQAEQINDVLREFLRARIARAGEHLGRFSFQPVD